ncbi:MAG: hypothetical protein R3C61_04965 [Bacteroidia bacterium]
MKRLHLFEFGDQIWLPKILRKGLAMMLKAQAESTYPLTAPTLQEFFLITGTKNVVDICAGSGGPWEKLLPELRANGVCISVSLTDKFPTKDSTTALPGLSFYPIPIDATDIPESLSGCRIFFTSFHHFRPPEARNILASTVESRQPIAIFEFTERKWQNLLGMALAPLVVWIQILKLKPIKWQWVLFTYFIPLLPLIYSWDGFVSHWRSYTSAELIEMTEKIPSNEYEWETGTLTDAHTGGKIHYLLGWDKLNSCQLPV